jgi:hypothetical protein
VYTSVTFNVPLPRVSAFGTPNTIAVLIELAVVMPTFAAFPTVPKAKQENVFSMKTPHPANAIGEFTLLIAEPDHPKNALFVVAGVW